MEEDIKEILTALDNTTKKQLDRAIENADKEWSKMKLEEDIDRLQKLIDRCKECKFATCEQCEINYSDVQSLQNLIARYKELEKENEELLEVKVSVNAHNRIEKLEKQNANLRDTNKTLYEMGQRQAMQILIEEEYIPKSKVKEKIEELQKEYKKISKENFINKIETQKVLSAQIVAYKKLLED